MMKGMYMGALAFYMFACIFFRDINTAVILSGFLYFLITETKQNKV